MGGRRGASGGNGVEGSGAGAPSVRAGPPPLRAGVVILTLVAGAVACGTAATPGPLPDSERRAIRDVSRAYVEGWRAGDPEEVLSTLAPDAVLMPPGREPVRGTGEIRAFWWPDDGSTTTITRYEMTIEEVGGSGEVGWARGRAELAWVYEKDGERSEAENRTRSLTVYRRGADGAWRIARRMWASAP